MLLQANHKGKYLLEQVCKQLNLIEHDYFGLRYVDLMDQRVSLQNYMKYIPNFVFSFSIGWI